MLACRRRCRPSLPVAPARRQVAERAAASGAVFDRLWSSARASFESAAAVAGARFRLPRGGRDRRHGDDRSRRSTTCKRPDGRADRVHRRGRRQRHRHRHPASAERGCGAVGALDAGRLTASSRLGGSAAPSRRGADHGAGTDRLGGVRGRSRRARNAVARAAVGDPAPRRGARAAPTAHWVDAAGTHAAGRAVGGFARPAQSSDARRPT